MGLLYTITRTLFELELSVSVAKIGTYLDQVVDVFYVTDQDGRKITDEAAACSRSSPATAGSDRRHGQRLSWPRERRRQAWPSLRASA